MKNKNIQLVCIAGIFTALVFVFTAYLHFPVHEGYVHVGDGFIYIAACILPFPYAVFTGAVGALLADCLTGYAIWSPASFIIKAISVLFFSRKNEKIITPKNLIALIPASVVCIIGYYLYESIVIVENFIAPLSCAPSSIIQSVLSGVLFVLLGFSLDKLKFKDKLLGGKIL